MSEVILATSHYTAFVFFFTTRAILSSPLTKRVSTTSHILLLPGITCPATGPRSNVIRPTTIQVCAEQALEIPTTGTVECVLSIGTNCPIFARIGTAHCYFVCAMCSLEMFLTMTCVCVLAIGTNCSIFARMGAASSHVYITICSTVIGVTLTLIGVDAINAFTILTAVAKTLINICLAGVACESCFAATTV